MTHDNPFFAFFPSVPLSFPVIALIWMKHTALGMEYTQDSSPFTDCTQKMAVFSRCEVKRDQGTIRTTNLRNSHLYAMLHPFDKDLNFQLLLG